MSADTPSLEMLARIIEQLPHPLFVKDRSFRYVLINDALLALLRLSREEVVGKTDYELLPKDVADAYRAADLEVLASAKVQREDAVTDGDGMRRVLATEKVPLRDESGEVTHVVGVLSDITRLKSELAFAQEDLVRKERLAVLGRLAGGVAHQIRNPLAAIKNAAYVVQRRLPDAETTGDLAQAIEIIHDEVQRANRIITDLLDYARVRMPMRKPSNLGEIIDRALAEQHVPSSIEVVRRIAHLPPIALDADQLEGALFNLLRNAIEAMPEGGTLTIEGEERGTSVCIRVADSGAGIPVEVRERLFEPLVTTKPLGLGLGLVTARTLIEGQSGTLTLASAAPACFEVCLPRTP